MKATKANLVYEITMRFETVAEQYEDNYPLEREIALQTEYLETQGEDLHYALDMADLVSVKLIETKYIKGTE